MQARRPIIALAPNDWLTPWVGRQQLLSRLASRGWIVAYSSGPLSIWDRGGPRWSRGGLFSTLVRHDGVWVDTPGKLSAYWPKSRRWESSARRGLARRLADFAGAHSSLEPLLLVFHPQFTDFIDLISSHSVLYHAYDAFSETPGWNRFLQSQEARLTDAASVVLAVSHEVGHKLAGPGPEKYLELPNGADALAFSAGSHLPCPADLAGIPQPRIGYVGRISMKLDVGLLHQMALARPKYQWVFIGPVTFGREGAADLAAFEGLRQLPNVHFLKEKPHRELPAYQGHMQVNILCYKSSPGWWVSCSPLKIFEYLATGRPVVASALASLEHLRGEIDMPEATLPSWLDSLDSAVAGTGNGTPDRRRALAARNSWDDRVDRLEKKLLELG